jgi:hypothetical protein
VNTEVYNTERTPTNLNVLDKDVQLSLRKFQYNFDISDKVLQAVRNQMSTGQLNFYLHLFKHRPTVGILLIIFYALIYLLLSFIPMVFA